MKETGKINELVYRDQLRREAVASGWAVAYDNDSRCHGSSLSRKGLFVPFQTREGAEKALARNRVFRDRGGRVVRIIMVIDPDESDLVGAGDDLLGDVPGVKLDRR